MLKLSPMFLEQMQHNWEQGHINQQLRAELSQQKQIPGPNLTSIHLPSISDIDKNILFHDRKHQGSPLSYVLRIIKMNKERLCEKYNLTSMHIDYGENVCYIQGADPKMRNRAASNIIEMLKKPLFTTAFDITLMVAMRVLNCVKTDFSTQTGCWVHFVWRQRTALFYGVDLAAGQAYLRSIIDLVKNCIVHGGCNGFMVQEYSYNMRVKRFLKKNVDNIEKQSSSNLVIQSEDPLNGTLRVQYFGSPKNIQSAHDMVLNYLGASKSPPSSDSSLSTGGNTPSSDQSVSDMLPESPTLDNVFPINVEGKQYLAMIPSPSTLAALREVTANNRSNAITNNLSYPNTTPAVKRQEDRRPVWNRPPNGSNVDRMYLEGLAEEVLRRSASNAPQPQAQPSTDSTWVVQLLNKIHTVGVDPLDQINNNSNMFHRVPPVTGPLIGDRYNHSMNMDVFHR